MIIMKNKIYYSRLFILFCITGNLIYGRLPGDSNDPSTRLYRGYAYGRVLDTENKPVKHARISVNLNLFFNYEEPTPRKVNVAVGYTNQYGYFNITVDVNVPNRWGSPKAHYMDAIVTGGPECYTVDHSEGSKSLTSFFIRPIFNIIVDCDGNGVDDDIEWQIVEKFKPVFHKHSYDLQEGFSNFDDLLNNNYDEIQLKWTTLNGSGSGSTYLSKPDIHYWDKKSSITTYDSFGYKIGEIVSWEFDIPNRLRHKGAEIGRRPLYYHIYKEDKFIYLQYWVFFNMNDLRSYNQSPGKNTWHEGDWEHVTIRLIRNNDEFEPDKINFYSHYGGYTRDAADCWWSNSNLNTYSRIKQGWDNNNNNLHIWVAANSHGMYNRFDRVFKIDTPTNNDVVDNVDYDPSGNNLYFTYDRLEKLGDITAENNIMKHSKVWSTHFKTKNKTKPWLGFAGRVGDSWVSTIFLKGVGVSHPAALMPPFRRGWKSFEVDYTSFGNELGIIKDKVVKIIWVQDPTYGD